MLKDCGGYTTWPILHLAFREREVAVPSTTPRHGLDGAFLRREAHRRWQVYLQMAAQRLEATRRGVAQSSPSPQLDETLFLGDEDPP